MVTHGRHVLRTIRNPAARDYITFIETSSESQGRHTLLEVILPPNGNVPAHAQHQHEETFTCLDGELTLLINKQFVHLKPGESITILPRTRHRIANRSAQTCQFRWEIAPGCPNFEQSIQIAYGLACDGQYSHRTGVPRSPLAMGYLYTLDDAGLPRWLFLAAPVMRWLSRKAVEKGVAATLHRRYVMIR